MSYQGPWLRLVAGALETIANINYNTPLPHPIDPAVVFDVLKIRRYVEEATALAVGAANDLATPTLVSVDSGPVNPRSFGKGTRLSAERKLRMRELACHRLSQAYQLDEIASNAATKECAPVLNEVGDLVLQRKPDDLDAKFAHFFLEKVPLGQQSDYSTQLEPLNEIIASSHGKIEALRTRATVKVSRDEFDSAARDITEALNLLRYRRKHHISETKSVFPEQTPYRSDERHYNAVLPAKDQPRGLAMQLLFQRASVYLSIACQHINECLTPLAPRQGSTEVGKPGTSFEQKKSLQDPSAILLDARDFVKTRAKRALKDYTAFLSHLDYSPNAQLAGMCKFNERVHFVANSVSKPLRASQASSTTERHIVYPISELFAAVPPPDLPPYPRQENEVKGTGNHPRASVSGSDRCEVVTYHPLLIEALHSLLLCHCLVQTPAQELQLHAYMVARLTRLCDGYPVFLATRAPAQADWVDVIHLNYNWIALCSTWEDLCRPSLVYDTGDDSPSPGTAAPESSPSGDAKSTPLKTSSPAPTHNPVRRRFGFEDSRSSFKYNPFPIREIINVDATGYLFLPERPIAIARWIREVPGETGTLKKKKRPKRARTTVGTVEDNMEKLDINE